MSVQSLISRYSQLIIFDCRNEVIVKVKTGFTPSPANEGDKVGNVTVVQIYG